jgi:hypothetical protein
MRARRAVLLDDPFGKQIVDAFAFLGLVSSENVIERPISPMTMITCLMGVAVLWLFSSSALMFPTAGPKRLNCSIAISARMKDTLLAADFLNSMLSPSLGKMFQ